MLGKFELCLNRVNFYLKMIGFTVGNSEDSDKTMLQRMRAHRLFTAHIISFNTEVTAEVLWVVEAVITGKSFLEITYLIPCLTLCFVSNFKAVSLLFYAHYINEFIDTMKSLNSNQMQIDEEENLFKKNLINNQVSTLIDICKKIVFLIIIDIILFSLRPLFIILPRYYKTGEMELEMPFIAYYPFNEFDLRVYPWIYIHQVWSAIEAVIMVYGPDCFFFTCCTFVHIQFLLLQYDMEQLINTDSHNFDKANFKKLAVRHIELMRCVNLLEKIFSKPILFNALTSSVIICVTGFNVLEVKNVVLIVTFTVFFIFGLMQIFLYCSYGDKIMRSSMRVGDAIYNSQWYNIGAAERKSFLIVLTRSQKPCGLTAYGFFFMNLSAFTSILSTSWSYFALLKTIYNPERT